MVEHFYSSTSVPFIKALIVEKKRAFSPDNLPVLRAMTYLNPDKIPKENDEKFLDYGKNDISMLYNFFFASRGMIFFRLDQLLVCLYWHVKPIKPMLQGTESNNTKS